MQACFLHVVFQLPNEFTRVGYLLDGIENNDLQLQAAMANIYDDLGTATVPGKRSDFEATAAYLLPKDPVVRRRATNDPNRSSADIGAVTSGDGGDGKKRKFTPKKRELVHPEFTSVITAQRNTTSCPMIKGKSSQSGEPPK